jgi:hypothetical protein
VTAAGTGRREPADRRFWAGLVLTACVALAVPAAWYAIYEAPWAPGHDDLVSLLLASEGKSRADRILSPPGTSRRSAREILGTIEPQADYGAGETIRDAYRLSINPPIYLGLLNVWRSVAGASTPSATLLSLLLGCCSACVVFWVVARERGWHIGLLFSSIYCFSPTYWEAALVIRQYALAALLAAFLPAALSGILRSGEAPRSRPAMAFVACGALLTASAYQSGVLAWSLLAGLATVAVLRHERGLRSTALRTSIAFALATVPFVLLATWQGAHGGPHGVPVHTLRPFGTPAETLRAALQVILSLFVDLPYAHLPLAGLAIAAVLLLIGLVCLAAAEWPASAAGTVLVVSIVSGCALYAVLIGLHLFPAWFNLRYFAAYSSSCIGLVGLVRAPSDRVGRRRAMFFLALLLVSSGSFVTRAAHYVATGRQEDRLAFDALRRAPVVLTDAREHAPVLQVAAHASPEATIWLVRLPLDEDACRAIGADAQGRDVAGLWAMVADRPGFERAIQSCLTNHSEDLVFQRVWLDLVVWRPSGHGTSDGS